MKTISEEQLQTFLSTAINWFDTYLLSWEVILQIAASLMVYLVAMVVSKKPRSALKAFFISRFQSKHLDKYNEEALIALVMPVINLTLQWLSVLLITSMELPNNVLLIIAKLLTAWVVIRFSSGLIRMPLWSRVIAIIAWSIAALSIVGILDPATELMDSIAIEIGEFRLSILLVIKGIIFMVLAFWVAAFLSRISERNINRLTDLTPSVRVLMGKFSKIIVYTVATFIFLNSIGIDLTAITIFGGAIGLGLGFGLQKVISNLVSGLILLLDKSIKPGDVIEIGDSFGWVNYLGARHISLLTRDGVEHLVPNEHLITEKVVNWSYSNTNIRLKIKIGVSYNSDIRKAMELLELAANNHKRVLSSPVPASRLVEFNDSSIDIELRIWINDPVEGVANVRSDIMLEIWDLFKENDIEIPFPQRVLHINRN